MRQILDPISVAIGVVVGNLTTLFVLFLFRHEIIQFLGRIAERGY